MSDRQHVHELIDRLPDMHISALASLLETMVEPASTALRNAPIDDEPVTDEDRLAAAEAREWLRQNGGKGIPHAEAMRRLELD